MKKFAAIALLSAFTLGCADTAPKTPTPEASTDAPAAEMHGEAHGEGEMTEPPAQPAEPAATEEKPAEAAAPAEAAPAEAAPAEAAPAEPAKPE